MRRLMGGFRLGCVGSLISKRGRLRLELDLYSVSTGLRLVTMGW